LHPITSNEISDLLYSAFYLSKKGDIVECNKSNILPQVINRLYITNRHGKKVTLITFENFLSANDGIGYLLCKNLLDKAYPLEVDHKWALDPITELVRVQKVLQALKKSDRLIILQSEDLNKIPGSILIDTHNLESMNRGEKSIITITIQPEKSNKAMCFDLITTKSLADIIESEMTKYGH